MKHRAKSQSPSGYILLNDVLDVHFRYVFAVRVRDLLLVVCSSCRMLRLLIIVILTEKTNKREGHKKVHKKQLPISFCVYIPPPPLRLNHCLHYLNVARLRICRQTFL